MIARRSWSRVSQRRRFRMFFCSREKKDSMAALSPAAPNRLWLTDITEHRTSEGKSYCCAVKDVFSNRIVGYSISDRMKAQLAVDALNSAVARRGGRAAVAGCVVHSDRGSQFRSRKFVRTLAVNHLVGSMGRVGACPLLRGTVQDPEVPARVPVLVRLPGPRPPVLRRLLPRVQLHPPSF